MADQKLTWAEAIKYRIAGVRGREVSPADAHVFGEGLTLTSLLGANGQTARARQTIYQFWQTMLTDPIVSGALQIHVTAALGGEESTGDMVFIEPRAGAEQDKATVKMVKAIADDLGPLFNRVATQMAYNGAAYGDAYARIYTAKRGPRKGVTDLCADEMMLPPLVQPYELGNRTVVCEVAVGSKGNERLTMEQIARMKMQRRAYVPQPMAIEKAWRTRVMEDDTERLPIMPALAGGSFLIDAEAHYNNHVSAMAGLVGQRVLDSIDESMFTLQMQGMTKEQRQEFMASIKQIFMASKAAAEDAVKSGRPFLGRIRHLLPVFSEKQVMQVQGVNASGGSGSGRAGNISIEDVLFHAKVLAGALGVDITMLGFADMMSGGLGEGGFFRTSVQAAERSRAIRKALAECCNHIIDVHVGIKHGLAFEEGKRPWQVNFFGNIAAMEAERQKTAMDSANTSLLLLQVMQQAKELGLKKDACSHFLMKEAKLSKEDADLYAKAIEEARESGEDQGAGGGFGGGFGGGGFGGKPAGGGE